MFAYVRVEPSEERSSPVHMQVGDAAESKEIDLVTSTSRPRGIRDVLRSFKLVKLQLPEDERINNPVRFCYMQDDEMVRPWVSYVWRKAEKNRRLYYIPRSGRMRGDYADHWRRNSNSHMTYVRRARFDVERNIGFRMVESSIVSAVLYWLTALARRFSNKTYFVFYEKFASKAEEGTFELFTSFTKVAPKSFFIIDRESEDYPRICHEKNVLRKYSLRYYWVVYRADVYVGTEVPTHLSLIRSNNTAIRRRIYERPYVFLQHGIIFMKNLGRTSVFVKDREGEPALIIASSEREKAIIERDLQLEPEKILVTGLGQFSLIQPNTIGDDSPDVITVMLTWRLQDEGVQDFKQTQYVAALNAVIDSVRSIAPGAKLRLVPHPKVAEALALTDLAQYLWLGKISAAMESTKLLITDYSSIAYNAFYRGSAVLFYQPDLESYELRMGPLIPEPGQYIGLRAFDASELKQVLKKALSPSGKVNLSMLRTREHEMQYKLINEFDDGANLQRIQEELVSRFSNKRG